MKVISLFLIILVVSAYLGSQITHVKNPFVIYYVSWAFGLILSNFLIGFFLYSFRHSVMNGEGVSGLKGKMGIRGEEGTPDYCNFCLKYEELNKMNKY